MDLTLAKFEEDKTNQLFVKLVTTKEILSVKEIEKALDDDNRQAAFHRMRQILWNLLTWDTSRADQALIKGNSFHC